MANIVKYNSRITLKYDSLTEWNKVKDSFIPLKGEVCVVNPSEDLGGGAGCLIKVGDGTSTFGSLPYLSGLAADVYDWAKLDYTAFCTKLDGTFATDSELNTAVSTLQGLITEITGTKIPALETAIDTLGNSLKGTGSATKTITGITYDASTNKATVTYGNIDFPDVDTALNANSNNAISNKAVQTKIASVESTLGGVSTTATNANNQANTNKTAIANIVNGTTVVPKATHAASADSATNATKAASADKATKDGSNNVIVDTYATKTEVESAISGINSKISNAMHFLGITSTALSDGATTATIKIGNSNKTLTAADAGAVVLSAAPSSTGIQYEYVWTGSAWAQLGQEGSFAVKGTIVNSDIASNAAIEQAKIASTLGKTNLAGDISDIDARLDTIEETNRNQDSNISAIKSYATVTGDNGSTTTAATVNDSLAIVGGTKVDVAVTTDTVTINHESTTRKDTTSTAAPAHEGTFTAVDGVTTDATGHVTAINVKTVTLPSVDDLTSEIAAHKSFSTVKAGSTDLVADGINDTLNVAAGTAISVTGNASTDTMTIAHANVTRTDPTKTTLTPTHGGKFTVAESVSSNAQGHVTAVQYREVQLPPQYDDSALSSRVSVLENNTWKTTTRNKVTQAAQGSFTSGLQNTTTGASTLNASDLTIGTDVIGYIVWDCGSASTNV